MVELSARIKDTKDQVSDYLQHINGAIDKQNIYLKNIDFEFDKKLKASADENLLSIAKN